MQKYIFSLLLIPILLVGICAVSASEDIGAEIPVVEHAADRHYINGDEPAIPYKEGILSGGNQPSKIGGSSSSVKHADSSTNNPHTWEMKKSFTTQNGRSTLKPDITINTDVTVPIWGENIFIPPHVF